MKWSGKAHFSSSATRQFSSLHFQNALFVSKLRANCEKRIRRTSTEYTKETMTLQLGSAETAALFQDTNATDEVSLPYIDNISPHELKAAETMVKEEVR